MKPIALISGCFDGPKGLHIGHRYILSEMRKLHVGGVHLVVTLNSDAYVARKGPNRPMKKWQERCAALYESGLVDEVIHIEDTPIDVIKLLEPDYICVGRNDYAPEQVVGYKECQKWGGEIVIIEQDLGVSSTQLANQL